MSSQKGQPKKKKPRLLPTLDELHSQRCADKATVTVIKTAVDRISDTDNVIPVERLRDLHPDNILMWLIAKHGSTTIFSLMKALNSLPKSLTECQREAMLMQACPSGISNNDLKRVCTILSELCMNDLSMSMTTRQHTYVMAPPTATCIECDDKLVAYHSCDVKYYSTKEVHYDKKFTLRCAKCCLLYNYSQTKYGDKHGRGFRYYPQEQPAVEVTDTVYFDRQLLDWQCSLA